MVGDSGPEWRIRNVRVVGQPETLQNRGVLGRQVPELAHPLFVALDFGEIATVSHDRRTETQRE